MKIWRILLPGVMKHELIVVMRNKLLAFDICSHTWRSHVNASVLLRMGTVSHRMQPIHWDRYRYLLSEEPEGFFPETFYGSHQFATEQLHQSWHRQKESAFVVFQFVYINNRLLIPLKPICTGPLYTRVFCLSAICPNPIIRFFKSVPVY